MKIFLTGGTGYLGAALLAGLLEAHHEVTVLTRRPREEGADARLTWLKGDLMDGPPPEAILHQYRAVVHSAALVKSWARDSSDFDRVNVEAYEGLLERCYRVGVPKVLHTSSFLSLGPAPTPEPLRESDRRERDRFLTDYERTKYLSDRVTDRWVARGLPVSTLYPTVLFGPGARTDGNLVGKMIWWIAQGRFPGLIGSGRQVWNYAYLPDVVQGHLLALERALPGEAYVLGGEDRSLESVLRDVHRLLGRPFHPRRIPIAAAEFLGVVYEWIAVFTGKAPDLTRGVAGVYRHHWTYSSDKAERSLGYRRTRFEDALSETVRWVGGLKEWAG